MEKAIKTLLLFCLFVLFAIGTSGQVTIGSGSSPVAGALLDLKEISDETSKIGGRSAERGLMLPRVDLQSLTGDLGKSLDVSVTDIGTLEPLAHTGLIVYHINKCSLNGLGLYIWDGEQWLNLNANTISKITLSKNYLHLPSGSDARGAVYPQSITVQWAGGKELRWNQELVGSLEAPSLTSPIGNSGILEQTPANMTFTPQPIEVPLYPQDPNYKPWISKESKVKFDDGECNQIHELILNQTNYAIKVNDRFLPSSYPYIQFKNENFTVESNATWQATIMDNPDSMVSDGDPQKGDVRGQNSTDGTTATELFKFKGNDTEAYNMAKVIFSDPETPKRFKDVDISIIKCNVEDFTLEEWATKAGFNPSSFSSIPNSGTLLDASNKPLTLSSGAQLHKDQNGNLFLSGEFGDAGRWMLNNLAATTFEPNASDFPLQIGVAYSITHPIATYPNKREDYYNKNKRVGLMYNYSAVVGSKPGGTQIQGICPNGWHVPSTKEWIELEIEIDKNTSQYAFMDDINAEEFTPEETPGHHNGRHGRAMKDSCPIPEKGDRNPYGISKVISHPNKPGFSAQMLGIEKVSKSGANDGNNFWGTIASFWLPESTDSEVSRSVYMTGDSELITYKESVNYSFRDGKYNFMSVRCKKD